MRGASLLIVHLYLSLRGWSGIKGGKFYLNNCSLVGFEDVGEAIKTSAWRFGNELIVWVFLRIYQVTPIISPRSQVNLFNTSWCR